MFYSFHALLEGSLQQTSMVLTVATVLQKATIIAE